MRYDNPDLQDQLAAQYALKRYSKHSERSDVQIILNDDYPFLAQHHGQLYLRAGSVHRVRGRKQKRPPISENVPKMYSNAETVLPLYDGEIGCIHPSSQGLATPRVRDSLKRDFLL